MKKERKHYIGGLLALLLLCVFAACVLSVLLAGAGTYRRLTERDRASYDSRTATQYLATRIRQADRQGAVSVRAFEGRDALVLTEEIDGELYETRIYYCDGYLRELFTVAGADLAPEDGEKILPAGSFLAYADDPAEGQLRLRIQVANGDWEELTLLLRAGREDAA